MRRWAVGLWMVVFAIALTTAGCSAKKKGLGPEGEGAGQVGEESLGAGAGSLDQARAGTLGGRAAEGPLKDVHFAYDSFELDEEARRVLRENGDWLTEHRGARVEIEGHCDERGTVEYNLALGAKRAGAVKSYLVSLGIGADRLSTISYGEELPLCHDSNESCWQRNRRSHPVVVGE